MTISYKTHPDFICVVRSGRYDHRPWTSGHTVSVKFLEGVSKLLKDAFRQADKEWKEKLGDDVDTINITWVDTHVSALVRIGEGSGVSWCYNGASALDRKPEYDEPTMMIGLGGWRKDRGSIWTKAEVLRIARHMVGHIYGLCHPLPQEDVTKFKKDAVSILCELGEVSLEHLTTPYGAQWNDCASSIMACDKPDELLLSPGVKSLLPKPGSFVDEQTAKVIEAIYPTNYPDVQVGTITIGEMQGSDPSNVGYAQAFSKYQGTRMIHNVLTGLTRFELPRATRFRLVSGVKDVGVNDGLKYSISTSDDSTITDASAQFLSFTERDSRIQTGVKCSSELRASGLEAAVNGEKFPFRVNFVRSFDKPPKVVVALSGFNISKDRNVRAHVFATDIDCTGFTLHLDSWGDTLAYDIVACWLAHVADDHTIRSGTFSHVDSWQQKEDVAVTPYDSPLPKPPSKKWFAFSKIDLGVHSDLKVQIELLDCTESNIKTKVSTWDADCKYYGLNGVYVVIL